MPSYFEVSKPFQSFPSKTFSVQVEQNWWQTASLSNASSNLHTSCLPSVQSYLTLWAMYKLLINLLSRQSIPVPFRICINLFYSHSTGLLKTLEIRASVVEDMKSKRAITTACQLFAHASSTLLVKCSSPSYKVSAIAVCIRMISAWFLIAATHTNDQEAADKHAWSPLPTKASVLHDRSLHASTQDMCLSAQVSGGETRVHTGRWHAGHSLTHTGVPWGGQ